METVDAGDMPFVRLGPAAPACPVVVSVPHAGRHYPSALLKGARLDRAALAALEDRHADLLVSDAVAGGATVFVATIARAWIDLNRDPRELDPAMIAPTPSRHDLIDNARVRGGLGLLPRRIGGADIHDGKIAAADLAGRIASVHTPWHTALASALAASRERFGRALLIDLHSMPALDTGVQAVIGDRFGHSASPATVDAIEDVIAASGLRIARNHPYAGGYTLERHTRRRHRVEAVQIEFDRRLYLAADLRSPGPGASAMASLVAQIVAMAANGGQLLAAE